MRHHRISSLDGTELHVADCGPLDAPAILLIHGWSQHHLSWKKQMTGPLAKTYRLVAPDLRGHGASEKPEFAEAYNTSKPWAEDIMSIIDALGLSRVILVGWSMGGWLIGDYLSVFGTSKIAGFALVGSSIQIGKGSLMADKPRRPEVQALGMFSDRDEDNLNATIGFVKACVAKPLSKQDLALMVGFNMLVPPTVRKWARSRNEDYREVYANSEKPMLVLAGTAEKICPPILFEQAREALPKAVCIEMKGCGHAPFWEDPATFDAHLSTFADQCFKEAA